MFFIFCQFPQPNPWLAIAKAGSGAGEGEWGVGAGGGGLRRRMFRSELVQNNSAWQMAGCEDQSCSTSS